MMATPAPEPRPLTPSREMTLPELVTELGEIRASYEAMLQRRGTLRPEPES